MAAKIFSSIALSDGRKCSIVEITPSHIWRAQHRVSYNNPENFHITAFILEQIVIIDGVKQSLDDLDQLSIKDYTEINQVVTVLLSEFEI